MTSVHGSSFFFSGILAELFTHQQAVSHVPYKSLYKDPAAFYAGKPLASNQIIRQSLSQPSQDMFAFAYKVLFRHLNSSSFAFSFFTLT